jgi:CubicO group peptidase (beta-lactamase class C family)
LTQIQGWAAPGWEDVHAAFQRNFEKGAEVGAAFAAYHRGRKVVDLWGGLADDKRGIEWGEDTLVLVYSTTKGVTAMCANRLADEGALDVEAPVREYWPEFAQAGKDEVTVADLLAHRAGLAWTDGKMTTDEMLAWDPVVRALEAQAPSWPVGKRHGYHAVTYGWLVGEVVRRVSGRSVGTYLREELSGPLDAAFHIGLPGSEEHRVARLVPFSLGDLSALENAPGAESSRELEEMVREIEGAVESGAGTVLHHEGPTGDMLEMAEEYLGRDSPLVRALTAPGGALRDQALWDDPRLHAAEIPAANGICDARSLARLYAACVSDVETSSGEAFRVFSSKQLDRATRQETLGPDAVLFDLDIQWGLGFMLNRGLVAGEGMGGPRSFGHFGMGGSVGWADPDIELGIGYVMNKMALGTTGDPRGFRLVRACVEAAGRA